MEAKLAELKTAMSKERAKREALKASGTTGSIWSNGGGGTLKPKGVPNINMQQIKRSSSQVQPACGSNPGSTSTRQPRPPKQPPAGPSLSSRSRSSSAGSGSGAAGTALPRSRPSSDASSSGSAAASHHAALAAAPAPAPAPAPGHASAASRADSGSRNGGNGSSATSRPRSQQPDSCGAACGGDDISLLQGTYDEAASRNSFLEAVREWRQAAPTQPGSSQAGTPGGTAGLPRQQQVQQPGKQVETAAMIIQTDAAGQPPLRTTSSFNHADALNGPNNSTTGGNTSYFQKMLAQCQPCCGSSARSWNSIDGRGAAAVDAYSSAGSMLSGVSGAGQLEVQPELLQYMQQQEATQLDNVHDHPAEAAAAVNLGSTSQPIRITDSGTDGEKLEDEHKLPEDGTAILETSCFDSWLQQAERSAEAVAALSITGGQGSTSRAASGPARSAAASATVAGYQQQLQQVLNGIEKLEEQQRQTVLAARGQSREPRAIAIVKSDSSASSPGFVCFTAAMRLPDAVVVAACDY